MMDESTAKSTIYPVPAESALDGEFTPDPELAKIGRRVIEKHQMTTASDCNIDYLWRDKGGKSKGNAVLGKTTLLTSLAKHYAAAGTRPIEITIWLAADHLRECGATYWQVEAVIHHELAHIAESDSEEDEPSLKLRGHVFEGFPEEIEHYGPWHAGLKEAAAAVKQLELFGEGK